MPRSSRRKRIKTHPCPYCTSSFNNEEGINRHIAHSSQCYAKREEDIARIASSAPHPDPDDPEGYESDNSEVYRQFHFLDPAELEEYLDIHEPLPPVLTTQVLESNDLGLDEESDSEVVEEGGDGDIAVNVRGTEVSKGPQGPYVELYEGAANILRTESTRFEIRAEKEKKQFANPYGSLQDQSHFDLVEWLLKSGLSRAKMDAFLKLDFVSEIVLTLKVQESDFPLDSSH